MDGGSRPSYALRNIHFSILPSPCGICLYWGGIDMAYHRSSPDTRGATTRMEWHWFMRSRRSEALLCRNPMHSICRANSSSAGQRAR